jgi:hypothetical protein
VGDNEEVEGIFPFKNIFSSLSFLPSIVRIRVPMIKKSNVYPPYPLSLFQIQLSSSLFVLVSPFSHNHLLPFLVVCGVWFVVCGLWFVVCGWCVCVWLVVCVCVWCVLCEG